jgi:hypothetical protein
MIVDGVMQRPTSLVVVAVLFILVGLWGAWDMISGSSRSAITIHFGVLGLAIGPGLLSLRPGWRKVAIASVWLMIAALVVATALVLFGSNLRVTILDRVVDAGRHRALALLALAPLIAASAWVYSVLAREDIKRLFDRAAAHRLPS